MQKDSVNLLGIEVNRLDKSNLNSLLKKAIYSSGSPLIIANHNAHSVYLHRRSDKMKRFFARADYIHIDGMSLVFAGKIIGLPLEREHRVTYVDWVHSILQQASMLGWRVFYLGAKPEVLHAGLKNIRNNYSNVTVEGHHGYFEARPDSIETKSVVQQIQAFQPHILMVGMGMPRQEKWILNNLHRLNPQVILPCGACIDYLAGAVPTPPRWMGQVGLEWLYRFYQEPSRLWYRNFIEPLTLLPLLAKDTLCNRLDFKREQEFN